MLSHKFIDKFIRHQNVERYRRLLEDVTDEIRRDNLLRLLAEAKQKQKDAGDPEYLYKMRAAGSGESPQRRVSEKRDLLGRTQILRHNPARSRSRSCYADGRALWVCNA